MRRTQVYLEDEQDRALTARAHAAGRTKSALIRDAIDSYLAPASAEEIGVARFKAAVAAVQGIAPYLPPGREYVEQIRAADRERQRELDARRS